MIPPKLYATLRSNIACSRYTGLFILMSVFPISTRNNSFENGCQPLKFSFITYFPYFSRFVTSYISLWFLTFPMVFPKTLLFKNLKKSSSFLQPSSAWYLANIRLYPIMLFKPSNPMHRFYP